MCEARIYLRNAAQRELKSSASPPVAGGVKAVDAMEPVERGIWLPLSWTWIQRVRQDVASMLVNWPARFRDAVVMTASELTENVVKYGEPMQQNEGFLGITITSQLVRIQSKNGLSSATRADGLRQQIERIANGNPEALYVERLRQMIDDPSTNSGLGLLRIAFEGQFRLAFRYESGVAIITAERAAEVE